VSGKGKTSEIADEIEKIFGRKVRPDVAQLQKKGNDHGLGKFKRRGHQGAAEVEFKRKEKQFAAASFLGGRTDRQ